MPGVLIVIERNGIIATGKIRAMVFRTVKNAQALIFQVFLTIAGIKDDFRVIGELDNVSLR
jgi:hypothetical protein